MIFNVVRSKSLLSGTVIPGIVEVHAVCIASPALRAHCSVLGTVPTLGFDIAQFINKLQVTLPFDAIA